MKFSNILGQNLKKSLDSSDYFYHFWPLKVPAIQNCPLKSWNEFVDFCLGSTLSGETCETGSFLESQSKRSIQEKSKAVRSELRMVVITRLTLHTYVPKGKIQSDN